MTEITPPPTTASLGPPELALVRYGELALKGGNRRLFEERLISNIHSACRPIAKIKVERRRGRLIVVPERRVDEIAIRLQDLPGIASVSPAWATPSNPQSIAALAANVLSDALDAYPRDQNVTFRVSSQRSDKEFPLTSSALDRFVADAILPPHEHRIQVRLRNPELELGIDVRTERSYVFARRLLGPGGLPVGTMGKALCLLSGGIDSPVAAWMAMKRGCAVGFISFHSAPYLGEGSKQKIEALVRALARYQPRSRLFVVPFTEAQTAIRDTANPRYRTVLYRRMMQRIASRVATRMRAGVLVTGESLGQVASQTMENLTCINDASYLPVLRPLIAFDKQDTVNLARKIGTYDLSNRPEPDCCTVFMPSRPVIRGRVEECEADESKLDLAALVRNAITGMETHEIEA